jgi:hypothetical protein
LYWLHWSYLDERAWCVSPFEGAFCKSLAAVYRRPQPKQLAMSPDARVSQL